MKTQQQFAFDKALHGVRKQGKLSIQGHNCAYRSADGTAACGIGHLIPDDLYKPEFDEAEDTSVGCMIVSNPDFLLAIKASGVDPSAVGVEFLKGLQRAHDDSSTNEPMHICIQNFEHKMASLASRYGLEFNVKA